MEKKRDNYSTPNHKMKNTQRQYQEETLVETLEEPGKKLILYNDDFNTFDFVIDTLIKICNHEPFQAEQCAILVHYTGKCVVEKGSYDKLEPLCTALLDRGLTAAIEE